MKRLLSWVFEQKYLLCNVTGLQGLTVTNWFSPRLCQWFITPAFKIDKKYFLGLSLNQSDGGRGKWNTKVAQGKKKDSEDTEHMQKCMEVKSSVIKKIWIIPFNTESATLTMALIIYYEQIKARRSPRITHGPVTQPPGLGRITTPNTEKDGWGLEVLLVISQFTLSSILELIMASAVRGDWWCPEPLYTSGASSSSGRFIILVTTQVFMFCRAGAAAPYWWK